MSTVAPKLTLEALDTEAQGTGPGRGAALELLAARSAPLFRRVAAEFAGTVDADDLVQSALLAMVTRLPYFDASAAPFKTWLLELARERMAAEVERAERMDSAARLEHAESPSAEVVALQAEEGAALRRAVASMPYPVRDVLSMRYGLAKAGPNGDSVATIRRRLRMSPGTVRVGLACGLEQVRAALAAQ